MLSDGPYGHLYELYFGDNIEWAKLEEFNMAELYDSENIKEESNKIADKLKRDIERQSVPPIEEFDYEKMLEAPLEVQNIWNQNIALMSQSALIPMDQVNIFFNGGNLTIKEIEGEYSNSDKILI